MKKIFIICGFSFLTLLFGCNTDKIQEKLGYVTKNDVDSLMSGMSQKIDSLSQLVVCLVQDAENKKKDTRPLFSVSASDRVFFSKGNLQYQPINGIWRFAENQYDVIGLDNEKISPKYTGWIDLFGWGTSGWKDAAKPSDVSPDYKNYFVGGGNTNSLTGFYAQGDWGRPSDSVKQPPLASAWPGNTWHRPYWSRCSPACRPCVPCHPHGHRSARCVRAVCHSRARRHSRPDPAWSCRRDG